MLLRIEPQGVKSLYLRDTCSLLLSALQITVGKTESQHMCASVYKGDKKMYYIYTQLHSTRP